MAVVFLQKGRERSLLQRHPWVFSGAVLTVEGEPEPGEVVTVVGSDGTFLGRGYYNDRSNIRVRILEWQEDRTVDSSWWRERIAASIARRSSLAAGGQTNAYRLVYADSDMLPGLIVDRYAGYLAVQFLTAGVDRERGVLIEALNELITPEAIIDRSDADTRKKEGLKPATGVLSGRGPGGAVEIIENGHRFLVDFSTGQKTGFYLDQRENRRAVSRYAAGRKVLDAFSYTGAFSVYAAGAGAESVTLVESSSTAIDLAKRNLETNSFAEGNTELVRGDVFEILRAYREMGRRFGLVVLDPPKFARTRAQAEKAMRAYKDVNMQAMSIVEPGGILATFSCSGGVSAQAFTLAVAWAALDAGRDIQILHRMGQPEDHPVLAAFPESEYLKGLICRVL